MPKSITGIPKKRGRGRPFAGGRDPHLAVRVPQAVIDRIDKWAANNDSGRSEAVRRLVELGLSHAPKKGRLSREARAKASAMAGKVVDQLADVTAPVEEQAMRKRRLIKGPLEFREMRQDQPIGKAQPGGKAKRP